MAQANRGTGGAQALCLSVPEASKRVDNLEESRGATLQFRTCQGMTLTPPRLAFVQRARRERGQFEHRRCDLQEHAEGIKGRLRVRASNGVQSGYPGPERKLPSMAIGVNELEGQQQADPGLSPGQTELAVSTRCSRSLFRIDLPVPGAATSSDTRHLITDAQTRKVHPTLAARWQQGKAQPTLRHRQRLDCEGSPARCGSRPLELDGRHRADASRQSTGARAFEAATIQPFNPGT